MTANGVKPGQDAPIILTPGDPAGIGGELTIRAHKAGIGGCFTINDPVYLAATARQMECDIDILEIASPADYDPDSTALQVLSITWAEQPVAGEPTIANAPQIIDAIARGAGWAQSGECAAMVTNPIAKAPLLEAGFSHPGHTEFLGSLAPPRKGAPMMMLAADDFRVVPITVHIPLSAVAPRLNSEMIVDAGRLLSQSLSQFFDIAAPRIAVCGLNPHAGEQGRMGHEDNAIIAPAIAQLQGEKINAFGPLPADTLFHSEARKTYDAVLGMYHDQVLIPLKTVDFFGGVNVTLGLDFIRTSPDHGTGFDIAGKGIARPDSVIAALKMASRMARKKI